MILTTPQNHRTATEPQRKTVLGFLLCLCGTSVPSVVWGLK